MSVDYEFPEVTHKSPQFEWKGQKYYSPYDVAMPCSVCGGSGYLVGHRNWDGQARTFSGSETNVCYVCTKVMANPPLPPKGVSIADQKFLNEAHALCQALKREARTR